MPPPRQRIRGNYRYILTDITFGRYFYQTVVWSIGTSRHHPTSLLAKNAFFEVGTPAPGKAHQEGAQGLENGL